MFLAFGLCILSNSCKMKENSQNQKLLNAIRVDNLEACKEAIASGASLSSLDGTHGEITDDGKRENNPLRIACFLNGDRIPGFLLEQGADPNAIDADGRSVFSYAVSSCSVDLCQKMIEHGADFQQKNKNGLTPLDYCFFSVGEDYIVEQKFDLLLNNGAQLSSKTLTHAVQGLAQDGYTRYNLIRKIAVIANEKNISVELPHLQRFILQGDLKSLKKVMKSEKTENALFYATAYGSHECVEYMLNNEREMTETDAHGNTLLAIASVAGNIDNLQWLVSKHDWNHNDWYDAVIGAAANNQLKSAEFLLSYKVDIAPRRVEGGAFDALTYAVVHHNLSLVELLLKSGFPVEMADQAFQEAVRYDQADVVQFLLDKNVDINRLYNNMTAFDIACFYGSEECIKLLLGKGADVNGNPKQDSPLQLACRTGEYETVKILLENGANVNPNVDDEEDLPITQAVYSGSFDIVKLLVAHGTIVNDKTLLLAKDAGSSNIYHYLLQYAN